MCFFFLFFFNASAGFVLSLKVAAVEPERGIGDT